MDETDIQLTPEQLDQISTFLGRAVSNEEVIQEQNTRIAKLEARLGKIPNLRKGLPLPGIGGFDAEGVDANDKRELFGHWIKCIGQRHIAEDTPEMVKRALSGGTTTAGGHLVPVEFEPIIIRIIEERAMMRSMVRHVTMMNDTKDIGTLTSGVTVYWPGENQTITQGDPAFGKTTLTAKKMAALVSSSSELLEDTPIDLADLLAALFGEAIADEEDRVILSGSTTAGDPFNGVLFTSGVAQVTQASGVKFDGMVFDDVSDTIDAITTKANMGAMWFFHRNVRNVLRKIKDTDNMPIWQPTTQDSPAMIYGYPFKESDQLLSMADSAASKNFLCFGNPMHIWFGDKREMTVSISTEAGFKEDEIFWRVTERFGLAAPSPAAAFSRLRSAAA